MPSKITALLVRKMLQRDATGLRKYGVSLDRRDLSIEEWLEHQTEELLDGAGYAQSAKREVVRLKNALRAAQLEIQRLKRQRRVLDRTLARKSPMRRR